MYLISRIFIIFLENNNIAKKIKSFEELNGSLMIDLSTPDKIYNKVLI